MRGYATPRLGQGSRVRRRRLTHEAARTVATQAETFRIDLETGRPDHDTEGSDRLSTRMAIALSSRGSMAEAFEDSLNDKATAMHFQRIVGALVASAVGAGRFYSEKVTQARDATARAVDGGNDEHGAPIGLESKAQRTREFAADMAMQAYALLAAAHGAIDAYKELTGEDWKAYEAPADAAVEKKAAASQMGAFGG
jgi:hypothetical protein